jgi:two-component system response regulator AtoC
MAKILIVDDELHIRKALQTVLRKEGHEVTEEENGKAALNRLETEEETFDLILLDLHMPEMTGMDLLKTIQQFFSDLPVIIITAYSTAETTMEAMRLGAFDYLVKPFDITQVKQLVAKALHTKKLVAEVQHLRKTVAAQYSLDAIVGSSPNMQEVYKLVGKVATSKATVLIQGESGTGKELIARSIHYNSPRAGYPLVTINCGAIPENLLESELFGYEKGAFTGATERKIGKFELAHQGTLFLDEVGELPMSLQVKLLRVLQEGEFVRIGGHQPQKVDVRILAATHRNLLEMVHKGSFREDLYYRLHVITIPLPSLRERKEDIPDLIQYFLVRYAKELGCEEMYISQEAMERLKAYDWPGNVRQLQNVVYRAVVMASGSVILPEHLPELVEGKRGESRKENVFLLQETFIQGFTMREVLRKVEMEAMKWALKRTSGNKAQAAKMLDISRKAFIYKCQEYQIDTEE